jgi:plasmid replication initiation protein
MSRLEATKNKYVKQHNHITASRYEFSVVEKRIIYLIIEQLNGLDNEAILESKVSDGMYITINFKPVLEVCELWSENENKNYNHVREAVAKLLTRSYEFDKEIEEDGQLEPICDMFLIIGQARIYKGKTTVKLFVPKMAMKYFVNLSKNYTSYNMFNALTLQSIYSQRMYEQCSRWKDTSWFKMSLDQMKEILNIPNGYNISYIKSRILDTAKKELYEKTELSFEYKEKKDGKRIVGFNFKVIYNKHNHASIFKQVPKEAVEDLILCLIENLPLSRHQAQIIAQSGKVTDKDVFQIKFDFNQQKNTLSNPKGWLLTYFKNTYGITF